MEKTLMLGKIDGRRIRGRQRMRWLDSITDSGHEFEQTPGENEGQGNFSVLQSMESQRAGHDLVTE